MKRFTEFPLSIELLEALHEMRFMRCTPIQEKVIPIALQGRDVAGMAQTGTGKTLAFLVPILQMIVPRGQVQALVVCPTRELALQVGEVAIELGGRVGVKTFVVYGGTAMGHQRKEVYAGPDIVVGTPGRVIDFIKTSVIRLRHLKWLVLDEADRMLDMGFIDDVDFILKSSPPSRQTMLFSATLAPEVMTIAAKYMHDPERVQVSPTKLLADRVEQLVFRVPESRKADLLVKLMRQYDPELCLVFAGTREATTLLARKLRQDGFEAGALSSLQSQKTREGIVRMFKEREFTVLVATDVAARGLDIDGITHVFNYEVPHDPEDYVHRIGRTARAGKGGLAVTLVSGTQDEKRLHLIEKLTKIDIPLGEHAIATSEPFARESGERGRDRSRGRGGSSRASGSRGGAPRGGGSRGGASRDRAGSRSRGEGGRSRDRAADASDEPRYDSPITAKPVEGSKPAAEGGDAPKKRRRRRRGGKGRSPAGQAKDS